MARAKSERISMFKEWWGEEMGMVGIGVPGGGVGVGDDGIAFSSAEMGDGGTGSETARRASDEDPGRQLMEANDGSDDDGESSGEGSSSDSA